MKNIGVWLDRKKAIIVTLKNDKETEETIFSSIEDFNVTSNKHIGGPQEIAKDRTYLEREKHQFKAYFKEVAGRIEQADAIFIAGPGETCQKLAKELKEHHHLICAKVKEIRKADSMTDNQVKALVRDFFTGN